MAKFVEFSLPDTDGLRIFVNPERVEAVRDLRTRKDQARIFFRIGDREASEDVVGSVEDVVAKLEAAGGSTTFD
jgi:hypothetical protein